MFAKIAFKCHYHQFLNVTSNGKSNIRQGIAGGNDHLIWKQGW